MRLGKDLVPRDSDPRLSKGGFVRMGKCRVMIYALPERALASFSIVGAKGYDTNLRSKGITSTEWLRFDALLQRLHSFTLEILSAVFLARGQSQNLVDIHGLSMARSLPPSRSTVISMCSLPLTKSLSEATSWLD